MDHFNDKANQWDTPEKIRQSKSYADKILNQLNHNHPQSILEVGCGTGLLGSHFINDKSELIGVDTSTGMLAVFNEKFEKSNNVQSLLLNLEENEFPLNKKFDLIISSMAFHHLKNPEAMVLKLKKLLTPKGTLAIIDLDEEPGNFHPDPKNMGVHHFGFSKATTDGWGKSAQFSNMNREIVNIVKKDSGEFPIFLATYFAGF